MVIEGGFRVRLPLMEGLHKRMSTTVMGTRCRLAPCYNYVIFNGPILNLFEIVFTMSKEITKRGKICGLIYILTLMV